MRKFHSGFTLVELMIVIAIIGILATALFPSVSRYISRGRDAARTTHLRDISNAIGAYYSDIERYPNSTSSGCLSSGTLVPAYMPVFLTDPLASRNGGCGANGVYGYASGTGYANAPQFFLGSNFENDFGGNYSMGTGGALINIVVDGVFAFGERTALDTAGVVRKGNGSGYILFK